MMDEDLKFLVALVSFPKFGAQSVSRLLASLGCAEAVWNAPASALAQTGIRQAPIDEFVHFRSRTAPDALLEQHVKDGILMVRVGDDTYPALLKEIHDPPQLLFSRGTLPPKDALLLAVVGSRAGDRYAEEALEHLLPPLVRAGVGIVSGLAMGCDGMAHRTTLAAGGTTHAVLASGLDWNHIGPRHHHAIAREMIGTGGSLLSELPRGTVAHKGHFPSRNRIISGLAKATLVVEGTGDSGTRITARLAMEQNRDVLVVPGSILSPLSALPHALLRQGATPVTCANDILEGLGCESEHVPTKPPPTPQNANEAALLPLLSQGPKQVDLLVRESKLPAALVVQTLTELELRDAVKEIGGATYRLA
ncbi:MAG: protecting protein DprA protein [Parcubacteria group bacterium GW2011_GWA2_56_7]|nr:MAG: protecting protein DprA protein [Parcubacteria group bacterium GW2011_GWA2_56_7]